MYRTLPNLQQPQNTAVSLAGVVLLTLLGCSTEVDYGASSSQPAAPLPAAPLKPAPEFKAESAPSDGSSSSVDPDEIVKAIAPSETEPSSPEPAKPGPQPELIAVDEAPADPPAPNSTGVEPEIVADASPAPDNLRSSQQASEEPAPDDFSNEYKDDPLAQGLFGSPGEGLFGPSSASELPTSDKSDREQNQEEGLFDGVALFETRDKETPEEPASQEDDRVPSEAAVFDNLFGDNLSGNAEPDANALPPDTAADALQRSDNQSNRLESGDEEDPPQVQLPAPPKPTEKPPLADTEATASTGPIQLDPKNTRHLAWLLGAKATVVALADLAGVEEARNSQWEINTLSDLLEVPRPNDIAALSKSPSLDATIALLIRQARATAEALTSQYGADHAALMEIALKTNALLVLYENRPALAAPVFEAVLAANARARLPQGVLSPLASALKRRAPTEEIHKAVHDAHRKIERMLRNEN